PVSTFTPLTQPGSVLGPPDYIAPEQLENPHGADIRADLYSLGCTAYFLLTGQVPFPGGNLIQKLDRQRWETPPSVEQLRAEIPGPVAAVVRKLMAKKPDDRYQTPAELADALATLQRTGQLPEEDVPARLTLQRTLPAPRGAAQCLAVTPSGQFALAAGSDRLLRWWDLASNLEARQVALPQDALSLAVAPRGDVVVVSLGATPRLFDATTGREVQRFAGHGDTIRCVAFDATGERIVSGGDDRTARVWDRASGTEVKRLPRQSAAVTGVVFVARGAQVAVACRDGTLALWDVGSGKEVRRFT